MTCARGGTDLAGEAHRHSAARYPPESFRAASRASSDTMVRARALGRGGAARAAVPGRPKPRNRFAQRRAVPKVARARFLCPRAARPQLVDLTHAHPARNPRSGVLETTMKPLTPWCGSLRFCGRGAAFGTARWPKNARRRVAVVCLHARDSRNRGECVRRARDGGQKCASGFL